MACVAMGRGGNAFDNIYIESKIANWEDLEGFLQRTEQLLQHPPGRPVRLIVVDSITHVCRDAADFGTGVAT